MCILSNIFQDGRENSKAGTFVGVVYLSSDVQSLTVT